MHACNNMINLLICPIRSIEKDALQDYNMIQDCKSVNMYSECSSFSEREKRKRKVENQTDRQTDRQIDQVVNFIFESKSIVYYT